MPIHRSAGLFPAYSPPVPASGASDVDIDLGQQALVANTPARVVVVLIDHLLDRMGAVPGNISRAARRGGDQLATDHEQPVIFAFHVAFNYYRP